MMSLFFAPDAFPAVVPSPKYLLVLRALESGDVDGALFFLETLPQSQKNEVLDAQLCAAVDVHKGAYADAFVRVQSVLPSVDSLDVQAKLQYQLGVLSEQNGQGINALAYYQAASENAPACPFFLLSHAEAVWRYQGVVTGRVVFEKLVQNAPNPEVYAVWARLERSVGQGDVATSIVERARKFFPDDPNLINLAAACYISARKYKLAIAALEMLQGELSAHPIAICNLAAAYFGLGRYKDALAYYLQVLEFAPDLYDARYGAVKAAHALALYDIAIEHARVVLDQHEDDEDTVNMLAQSLFYSGRQAEAIALMRDVGGRQPENHGLRYLLGVMLYDSNQFEDAEQSVLEALKIKPEADHYYDLLASLQLRYGAFDLSEQNRSISIKTVGDQSALLHSNSLFALHYNPKHSPKALYDAHRAFGARFDGVVDDLALPLRNTADPHRKIRIGYVSPDFRAHSVSFFSAAPIMGHNREKFEVYLYSNSRKKDQMTDRFKAAVDHWREIHGVVFDNIRQMIIEDEIDILVDLAGHTGNNLLPVFARRAAPIQVSYIGYPNSTGLAAMDYRIVDDVTDPVGDADTVATETLVRLPESFLCYRMVPDTPQAASGPLSRGLPMTYGSFNNIVKCNDHVFDAWARILLQVPDAKLMLKAEALKMHKTKAWVLDAFAARGVEAERIILHEYAPSLEAHLDLYGQMDVALDTFPYNGTTTTCEALVMGVPVLTMSGDRHCARVGQSLMTAVGLHEDWVAHDVDDYVRRAVMCAEKREEIASMRLGLRSRLLASPLCDEDRFVKNLEAAYVKMWHDWCHGTDRRYSLTSSSFEEELRQKCTKT